MSVEINPHSQLGFPRPLTQLVTRPLTITNSSNQSQSFKVKTTAPRQYCVKPNTGFVAPNQSVEVAIMSQPMEAEPPLNGKCKDKFLVQTAPVPSHLASLGATEFWAETTKTAKDAIVEQKLRVAWLPPKSAAVPEEPEEDSLIVASKSPTTPTPSSSLTPAQLEAENAKLRTQLQSQRSKIPKVPLPLVAFLLAFVAAGAAAATWYAIENDLLRDLDFKF